MPMDQNGAGGVTRGVTLSWLLREFESNVVDNILMSFVIMPFVLDPGCRGLS